MRRTNLEAAQTRDRIVASAAAIFRQQGVEGARLADIMAGAGLTHGGFYKHFASKEALLAEACEHASAIEAGKMLTSAQEVQHGGLAAIAASYLSPDHRDDPAQGCPFAAIGEDLARSDQAVRTAATEGCRRLVDVLARQSPQLSDAAAQAAAWTQLATLVGAMTLARIVNDPSLSDSILDHARDHLSERSGKA